jgi:calcineurin-like phosphoesterase family protein
MIYFASDTHFSHNREFVYKIRGFDSVEAMNSAIIEKWNAVVKPEDDVYLLGDIMLNDNDVGMECLAKLNGKIHILIGNHDTNSRIKLYGTLPNVDVIGYATVVKYGKYTFYLSHYPTLTSNLDDMAPLSQHVLNLFGHTHQTKNFYNDSPYMYHVGMDSHDCTPVSAEQVIADIKAEAQLCLSMLGEEIDRNVACN